MTCAGPFGIEALVKGAGPLPTIVGMCAMPFVWATPIGYLTAELSTMFPENGGSVVWVREAFGPTTGFVNGWTCFLGSLFDLPTYVLLGSDYIVQSVGDETLSAFGIQCTFIILIACINIRGIEVIEVVEKILVVAVLSPFILQCGFDIGESRMKPHNWSRVTDDFQPGVFCSVAIWLWLGWDSLGFIAGDVKNPAKTFLRFVYRSCICQF